MRNVVDKKFERRQAGLINSGQRAVLRGGRKGVERESLRVTPAGELVETPHPAALGAPLTNEHITTDFSESLIELVTPPFRETWELLQYLCDIHQFVYRHLGDELLWTTSMPCAIAGDDSIPLAQFGTSNVGRMKTIYTTDMDALLKASDLRFEYYDKERLPTASWVQVERLVDPGFLVEIEAVAELP